MENHTDYKITWVGLLLIKDRKILTTREKDSSLFQLPGGGQEKSEDNIDTLKREVMEELRVEIKNPQLYDDFILPGRHEDIKIRFIIYTAEILGKISEGEEIGEIRLINSKYQEKSLDIGNPAKLVLIPRLLAEKVID